MGNVNITVHNTTNGTNYSIPQSPNKNKAEYFPPKRGAQSIQAIEAQIVCLVLLVLLSLAANIFLTILLQRKFKSLPYTMLQNIVYADMFTPLLTAPMFIVGMFLDQHGIIMQDLCNIQGFLHSTLSAVFLNTVSMVAISRCMAVLKPSLYHQIFVNKIILRLMAVGIWSISALICVPPMNYKSGWGAYRKLEMTCWLAWLPDEKDAMAYNFLVTWATLGIALTSSLIAANVVLSKAGKVEPESQKPTLAPYPQIVQNSTIPSPETQMSRSVHVNTEVFYLTSAMFILYLILWVPLTVMDWSFLRDWRDVDYRVIISFIFLFLGRSLLNPILFFVISPDIRKEFVNLFCRCKCRNEPTDGHHIEL